MVCDVVARLRCLRELLPEAGNIRVTCDGNGIQQFRQKHQVLVVPERDAVRLYHSPVGRIATFGLHHRSFSTTASSGVPAMELV